MTTWRSAEALNFCDECTSKNKAELETAKSRSFIKGLAIGLAAGWAGATPYVWILCAHT